MDKTVADYTGRETNNEVAERQTKVWFQHVVPCLTSLCRIIRTIAAVLWKSYQTLVRCVPTFGSMRTGHWYGSYQCLVRR
ncbi:MAG: hypothetical protein SPI30_02470 [Prevotella sp.]|nr:hypothetical protein [Prevotella sp.]